MGNSESCCIYPSNRPSSDGSSGKKKGSRRANGANASNSAHAPDEYTLAVDGGANAGSTAAAAAEAASSTGNRREESVGNLQHISEREPDDWEEDPSLHPTTETLFMEKSKQAIISKFTKSIICLENYIMQLILIATSDGMTRKRSQMQLSQLSSQLAASGGQNGQQQQPQLKKSSSCSTIFIDDSTVSQPNLKGTIKCVALAIYYHIKNRAADADGAVIDIFDEARHPLTVTLQFYCIFQHFVYYLFVLQRDPVPPDYSKYNPEHRSIYRFIRTLFNAAQLTAECAIITLVYLER